MRECIEIPTKDTTDIVEVFLDELSTPEEVQAVCELIASEEAPPSLYLRLARMPSIFEWILESALSDCKLRAPTVASELLGMQAMLVLSQRNDIERATVLLNQAERMDSTSHSLWARKGLLLLMQTSGKSSAVDAGELQFKAIIDSDKSSIVARIGLGLSCFKKGEYKDAMAHLDFIRKKNIAEKIIRDATMAYGTAAAACGNISEALQAFQDCIKNNPKDFDAIKCLGVTLLGAIEKLGPSAVHQGLQYLKQFYTEYDREDPVVLILLADHFFYKKDYAKALTLSTSAANSTRPISDQLRANAVFMQAKCYHAQSMLDDAFSKYLQVTKLDPTHPAGLFGLAQLYVHRNDLGSAIKCLELIQDGNEQARALQGCLYVQRHSETEEEDFLEKAASLLLKIQIMNHPPVVKLALAIVLENKDPERALRFYGELLKEHPDLVESPERLANISLLYLHFGKISEARNIIAKVNIADSNFKFLQALLQSDSEDDNQFKEIGSHPALLYLAHKYIGSCRFQEATELFKELLGLDEQNREAWFGMAVCHLRQRAFTPARKCFERILGSIDKHDLPSLCGLAVVYIEMARRDPERHASLIRRSLEFSGKALSLEPQCHVAANASGVALAELGLISSARDAFLTLLDLSSKLPENRFKMDVLNNVGCVMVESGQFDEGQLAFQKALEIIGFVVSPDSNLTLYSNRRAQFILLYSRAAYAAGKHALDARHFRRAISKLEELKGCDEELLSMGQFDIALCQQEAALALFKKCAGMVPGSATELLTEALELISSSITCFSALLDGSNSLHMDMIKQRLSYSNSLLTMIEKRRDEVKEKEVTRLNQLQQVRAVRSKAEEHARLQEDMESKRLKEEQALIEEQRKKLADSVKISEEPKMEEIEDEDIVEEHPKKKGKRKKKEPVEKSPSKKSALSKEYISSSSSSEGEARNADELDELFS